MKKVIFIIPSLGGGGAERVFLHVLKNLDRVKLNPHVVLFEKKGELLSELPSDIGLGILKQDDSTYKIYGTVFIKLALRLSQMLKNEKPDVIVSFMWYTNFVTLIAKILSRTPARIVVSERYGLAVSFEGRTVEFLRRMAIKFFYPAADTVIANSRAMANQLRDMFHIPERRITTIYNPVDARKIVALAGEEMVQSWLQEKNPLVIGIGRFTRQKGFDYLIRAVQRLNAEGAGCRLILLGKGPEEANLKALASELGIGDKVLFPGFQQNPYKYLARSAVFALSSLYEGFPNVLLEAMALGVPSVATRCPTGPDEIITDGVNGILVPPADETALAEAIKRLLGDEGLRKRLGEAGRKRAEDFAVEKIVKQYEDAIEAVCAGSAEN